ncbi:MAG: STAS domain-containing protein [Azonexus sp.]|jgi:anti-anti-sigma factor|nr:STAS domain-containing protein [Azonexus sp.]
MSPLTVVNDLTIYHAIEQKQTLLDALAATDDLELNLAQVGEMDTAGLQLLVLLKKEAQKAGKRVRIVAHSQAVSALIDFCNMAAEFGDPLVIPASESA